MTWMNTYTGRKFSFIDPQPEDVDIEDISQHLGKTCRYIGAVKVFYSVAQHLILTSTITAIPGTMIEVPFDQRWNALMHDTPEAYYGDASSPFKQAMEQLTGVNWNKMVEHIDIVVSEALKFKYPIPKIVKQLDRIAMATEKRDLMLPSRYPWLVNLPDPLDSKIIPYGPDMAVQKFREAIHSERSNLFNY